MTWGYYDAKNDAKNNKPKGTGPKNVDLKRKKAAQENRPTKPRCKGLKFVKEYKRIRPKFRIESSDSEDSLGVADLNDIIQPSELDYQDLDSPENLKVGDFILVKCKGGSRQSTTFRYVATVLKTLADGEIEVMGFKSCDEEKKSFLKKEDDIFIVSTTDILGKLPAPNVCGTSDRHKYVFDKIVEVFEA